jgi:hypothetical protein
LVGGRRFTGTTADRAADFRAVGRLALARVFLAVVFLRGAAVFVPAVAGAPDETRVECFGR